MFCLGYIYIYINFKTAIKIADVCGITAYILVDTYRLFTDACYLQLYGRWDPENGNSNFL